MCRKSSVCSELGSNPTLWSIDSPLPVPREIQEYLPLFIESVRLTCEEKHAEALQLLAQIDSVKAREFFTEHGQQSAYFRVQNRREIDRKNKTRNHSHSTKRLSASLEREAFERDGFRCRYCTLPIVDKRVYSEFSRVIGSNIFSVEKKNSVRHGITLIFRGVADHLTPFASGGETTLENLVTSCYSCNFGKAGYTIEQLGISNPLERAPIKDISWQGALEFLKPLKALPTAN